MKASRLAATALPLLAAFTFSAPAVAHEGHDMPGMFRLDPEEFRVMEFGAFRGSRLGVQVSSMTEELREAMGAPKSAGILVNRVLDDTPAEKAGLKAGDVLVEVAGEEITRVGDVWKALSGKDGDVPVEVIRDRRRLTLTAKIDKRDDLGRSLITVNPEMRAELESLRARIKDLERRLEKLEKR